MGEWGRGSLSLSLQEPLLEPESKLLKRGSIGD